MLSGILIHGCPAEHHTLKRGLILVLSSSVPPIIERISGYRSSVIDTADPQMGQKWRHSRFLPSRRVSYVVSLPSIVTASREKMTPIRNADPDCRWQRSHWQSPMVIGSPSYRYCTAPQRQRPVPPRFVDWVIGGSPIFIFITLMTSKRNYGRRESRSKIIPWGCARSRIFGTTRHRANIT